MQITELKCSDLIGAEYNPRKLSDKQRTELKDSLTRFGFVDPVLVNINEERKNIIIGGHQRKSVWEEMGNKTIPCIELDLTLDQEKELNVRLNKSGGDFDMEMLEEHFDTDDLVSFGFDAVDFDDDVDLLEAEEEFPDLGDGADSPIKTMSFTLSVEQSEVIEDGIKKAKIDLDCVDGINENSNGNALHAILRKYINE